MVILIIKPIDSPELIKQVAQVESDTWGLKPGDSVPDHVLTAIARNGGVLLGAYDADRLIGFTLGWIGLNDPTDNKIAAEQLKLVSHMTGVLSGYRDQRVGFHLKLAQREWALARGLYLVTWTYDPLESRNAYLNIHLLGCTCHTYFRDYYGEMTDGMNQGIASDRFRVDWWIDSDHVINRIAQAKNQIKKTLSVDDLLQTGTQLLNPAKYEKGKPAVPTDNSEIPASDQVLLEIPPDFQVIRQNDLGLAGVWRFHTRELFEILFAENYQVVDHIFLPEEQPRSFYYLEKNH